MRKPLTRAERIEKNIVDARRRVAKKSSARYGNAGPTADESFQRTAALREKVEEKFIPLFDHLMGLAQGDLDRRNAQSAGRLLREARKLAGEHAPNRTTSPTASEKMSRRRLSSLLSLWGSDFSYGHGSGSVGAVASFYIDDKPYPNREIVEAALGSIEGDIPRAERGDNGWTKRDAGQLRTIARGLRYFLRHDYS